MNRLKDPTFWITIAQRFLRAFVAGAIPTMIIVPAMTSTSWHDLGSWLSALVLAGISGGVTGILMAADKAIRFTPNDPPTIKVNPGDIQPTS